MQKKKVAEHIINWLEHYISDNKLKGFTLGISGGIDSALTSELCARTGLPLLCLEMPIHQDAQQVNLAKTHIAQLKGKYPNVESQTIDLSNAFDAFEKTLPKEGNAEQQFLALANSRARLRMTALYYFAGIRGLVV